MVIVNCCHPKEHEDDRLGRRRKHFHRVFGGGVGFMRNVTLYVVLHSYSAECYPVTQIEVF